MPSTRPELSIVTTLFRSEAYVEEFYDRVLAAAARVAPAVELIFVNDGSPDGALDLAVRLAEQDSRVMVIDLSRNFGQHKALMTGLMHCQGRLVFYIDSDLEVDPAVLCSFHDRLRATGADAVYGVQDARSDGFLARLSSALFYASVNWLSTHSIPRNLTTVRLMTRRYVEALISHQEREVALAGLWSITGFMQVPVDVRKRFKGSSSYSLPKKLDLTFSAITSFSNKPLVVIFYLGAAVSFVSISAAVLLLLRWFFFGAMLEGWLPIVVSIWTLGGLTLFSLGVIGLYLSRVFSEVKQRPYTIIRDIHQKAASEREPE